MTDLAYINRRQFLAGTSVALLGAASPAKIAFAQTQSLAGILPGVLLPETMRATAEATVGARIENLPYISATDTVAKLLSPASAGRYDFIYAMLNFTQGPLMAADALEPFDLSLVPNWKKLSPEWQKQAVVRDGKCYMIPVMWAYDSVLYNKDHISEEDEGTQSWGLLFDDRLAGRVALRDDAYQTITLTALHLGIQDPSTMSSSDLKQVISFLKSKKRNFRTLWSSFGEAVNLMKSQEVWAMMGWMSMRLALQNQKLNITNNWPREGLLTFTNAVFIPKGTVKTELSHKVANYLLSDDYARGLTDLTDYGVTNQTVIDGLPQETFKRIGYDISGRGIKTYPYTWPEEMDSWIEAWNSFKVS